MRFISIIFLVLFLLPAINTQAQDDFIKQTINARFLEGDCATAEQLYTAWKKTSGKTDKSIEKKIDDCKKGIVPSDPRNRTITVKGVTFNMIYVEGGVFKPIKTEVDTDNCVLEYYYTGNQSKMENFYISESEVTQLLWRTIMGSDPVDHENRMSENGKGDDYPVYLVGGSAVDLFIERLNKATGLTFRYPTTAEWQYAASGGQKSKHFEYSGSDNYNDVAWFYNNSNLRIHPVKQKKPNELGIYDMSGNVAEYIPESTAGGASLTECGGSCFDDANCKKLFFIQAIPSEYEEIDDVIHILGPAPSVGLGLRLVLTK